MAYKTFMCAPWTPFEASSSTGLTSSVAYIVGSLSFFDRSVFPSAELSSRPLPKCMIKNAIYSEIYSKTKVLNFTSYMFESNRYVLDTAACTAGFLS